MNAEPNGVAVKRVDDRYDIKFERDFEIATGRLWKALTTEAGLAAWLSDAEVNLWVGGRFRLVGACNVDSTIMALDAPRTLAWSWPHPAHPDSVVEWTLSKRGPTSHLSLVQTSLDEAELVSIATGWHTHLEALPGAARGVRTPLDPAREAVHAWRYEIAGLTGASSREAQH